MSVNATIATLLEKVRDRTGFPNLAVAAWHADSVSHSKLVLALDPERPNFWNDTAISGDIPKAMMPELLKAILNIFDLPGVRGACAPRV